MELMLIIAGGVFIGNLLTDLFEILVMNSNDDDDDDDRRFL